MPRVVTLTTDFGTGSGYVAELKGRLLHAQAAFTLVDIAHDLPPHDIRAAAWLVGQACFAFPPDTLHVVVVDPGVGTSRRLVWARLGDQAFLCPDNGVLGYALRRTPLAEARTLGVAAAASTTFHGRDVLAPAAIRILDGERPDTLGPLLTSLITIEWPEPRETAAGVEGEVIHIDTFGNLVTNLPAALWPRVEAAGGLTVGSHRLTTLVRTYGDAPRGTAVALVGSQGFIEAAVVEGRAADLLAARIGTRVGIARKQPAKEAGVGESRRDLFSGHGVTGPPHGVTGLLHGATGLRALSATRYTRGMLSPEELRHWDRHHVWHAFTQMQEYEPLLIERGEGAWLVDSAGTRYLDGSASMWCAIHGHRHPRLDAALQAQLAKVAHTTNLGLSNSTTVEFAHRLAAVAPPGLDRAFFTGDGSSAIETALKMAFQYWLQAAPPRPDRTRFIAIGEAYHGDTLGAIGVGGVDRFTAMFAPLTFEAIRLPSPGGPCPATGRPAPPLGEALENVEQALITHAGAVAAIVMEPLMQAAAGIYVHPPGFLRGVAELARRHDVLLILDEVAVGFGRTGTMFACQQEDVFPDFLCLAKGLTAGYLPMAATLTTERIWNAFLGSHTDRRAFFHGHTYGGNPLAAAVGIASLDIFRDERTLESLSPKIERLREHAARIARLPHVGAVRQCGLAAGFDLVADKATGTAYPWQEKRGMRACLAARPHGALLRPLGDVVVAWPPLSITLDELDLLLAATEAGIRAATEA